MEKKKESFGSFKKSFGLLKLANEEVDSCLMYNYSQLFSVIKCQAIPSKMMQCILLQNGFQYSDAHTTKGSFKTDAPSSFIWDVIRNWFFTQNKPIPDDPIASKILNKAPLFKIDFDQVKIDSKNIQKVKGRYFNNPPYWGPKSKAKSHQNQN